MPTSPEQPILEALARALDPRDFATTLTTGLGRAPRLTVTSRHAVIGDDVYTADGWFWWGWAEPIAPITDVAAAAAKVTRVLGTAQRSVRG